MPPEHAFDADEFGTVAFELEQVVAGEPPLTFADHAHAGMQQSQYLEAHPADPPETGAGCAEPQAVPPELLDEPPPELLLDEPPLELLLDEPLLELLLEPLDEPLAELPLELVDEPLPEVLPPPEQALHVALQYPLVVNQELPHSP